MRSAGRGTARGRSRSRRVPRPRRHPAHLRASQCGSLLPPSRPVVGTARPPHAAGQSLRCAAPPPLGARTPPAVPGRRCGWARARTVRGRWTAALLPPYQRRVRRCSPAARQRRRGCSKSSSAAPAAPVAAPVARPCTMRAASRVRTPRASANAPIACDHSEPTARREAVPVDPPIRARRQALTRRLKGGIDDGTRTGRE